MSSYQKNTSNNSGIVIDNLQVNKTANIPNVLTTDGDYTGVNTIAGTKNFKTNVGFTNGITAQGSSTINNLNVTGSFTAPNGGWVDITSKQSITGEKSFASNLSSKLLNITGVPVITYSFSDTVATTQTANINGSTLSLLALNPSVTIGQKITISNNKVLFLIPGVACIIMVEFSNHI